MYGIKTVLALGLLLATTHARPDGYGVKGARNHNSRASASASAQATAHASGGCLGTAMSSATATANAEAIGSTSKAAASANAFVDRENIGKAISPEDATGNANPVDDSEDGWLPTQHAKESMARTKDQENRRLPSTGEHTGNIATHGNPGSVGIPEQNQVRRSGCDVPTGVKGRRRPSGCTESNARDNKPSASNPSPTPHQPGLTTESQYPKIGDGFEDHSGKPGGNYDDKCAPGDAKCIQNRPSGPNRYPTNHQNPDLSTGSKYPVAMDGGYEDHTPNSETGPCTPGAAGCSPNKPSISNQYPTYYPNTDPSVGSKYPMDMNVGYGGDIAASENGPSVLNPHAIHPENGDSSPDSQHTVDEIGVNSAKPGDTRCFAGDPRCVTNTPKPAIPDPATTGIITSVPIPCPPGAISCPRDKSGFSNPDLTDDASPGLSVSSKYPSQSNGWYGGEVSAAGENPSPGTSAHPGSPKKPHTSNPFLNGQLDVSSVKNSGKPSGSSEFPEFKTNPSNPFLHPHGQVGPPTGKKHEENPSGEPSSESEVPKIGQNPSNPFLSHHGSADSPNDMKIPESSRGIVQNSDLPGAEDHSTTNGDCHGAECAHNQSGYPTIPSENPHDNPEYQDAKPNPSNPFLTPNGKDNRTMSSKYPNLKPPILTNPGSFGERGYDRIDPHSGSEISGSKHRPESSPGKTERDSDPVLVDDQSSKPQSKPGTGSQEVPNFPTQHQGQSTFELPNSEREHEVVHDCQGENSSTDCNNKSAGDNDVQHSQPKGYGTGSPSSIDNYGVKMHRPGVKGGSRHRSPPSQFQGSSGLGRNGFDSGNVGPAQSTAAASAYAGAHSSAHASSSSCNGGGHSNAGSEAHSNFGGPISSNAWASSSASSRASAFANNGFYQVSGNRFGPQIPIVPAQ